MKKAIIATLVLSTGLVCAESSTDLIKNKENFWFKLEIYNTKTHESTTKMKRFVKMKNCILWAHQKWEFYYNNYDITENTLSTYCFSSKRRDTHVKIVCDAQQNCNV